MKLTKSLLIKLTKEKLTKLNYYHIRDSLTGAQGLYIKKTNSDHFLTLGLTISRYYDSMFTAAFYLSKTTRWASVWGDIPKESYKRIGGFLPTTLRKKLLDDEFTKEGVVDAWWNADNPEAILKFLETVEITEESFLNQPGLLKKIDSSNDIALLTTYSNSVCEKINSNKIEEFNYQFTPAKEIDGIPFDWFRAAELVLFEKKGILNNNTVKLLAADAWHQTQLSKISHDC